MNKTTNYQLNQWETGDRVLRTDFNADNGLFGQGAARTLTFDHKPLVLLVGGINVMVSAWGGGYVLQNGTSEGLSVIWGENSVSWYSDDKDKGQYTQMNVSGRTYTYVALLQI